MNTEPKLPEPVAFIDSLQRGRPDCVTDLKYCSVLQHERGDHLKYIPVITTDAAQEYAEALAAARVAQEREWCAKLCETPLPIATSDSALDMMEHFGEKFAAAIRQQPPETGKEPT